MEHLKQPTALCMILAALARSAGNFSAAAWPVPLSRASTTIRGAFSWKATTLMALSPETPRKRKIRNTDAADDRPAVVTPIPENRTVPTSEVIEQINPSSKFRSLGVSPEELRPSRTLTTGQCFHWTAIPSKDSNTADSRVSAWGTHDATEWVGVIKFHGESLVVVIRETPTGTLYRTLTRTKLNVHSMLHDYFQLDENLSQLYDEWSSNCPRLKTIAGCLAGVRIVNQDPFECLISFICSSNNNIPRITKMLSAIREKYGEPLLIVGDKILFSFPSLETLHSQATEERLRDLGLGYRAKYIMETTQQLVNLGGESYLNDLRQIRDPLLVQEKLIQFSGVGRKVGDCVALFSLKQDTAIPVDIHVWNIARRDYDSEGLLKEVKSMTPSIYKSVGDLFRTRFPNKSGWAHSLLFVAELPSFRSALPDAILREMDLFREEEKARKKK